ncbi:DUF421 domain-containing protein [Salinicoccus roseus]|uniref:DUF421 domain-containing protein n=2 Tax=Salinicoccus roseus TaxID=45670 RepID=UPI000F4E8F71|nr:DUF421 domain-containing protein [Salinicoccus roseus]RPE53919.1 uncharacterized membrane protein YcaP (DUF421 family) [Salinicoccus roseus]GGA69888.1 DUF421 domain-containing protein [Salinicoccus roseus]
MEDMLTYVVKLTTGLIGVIIVLRLLGKKEMAQITPLDFVYALILGSIVEEALYETTMPFYEMLFALAYWALLIYVIEKVALKNERFRRVMKGRPELLINDGIIDVEVMDRNNMDVDEVRELLRLQQIFSLKSVKYAVLENSGMLSVIQYASEEPALRRELKDDDEYDENEINYLFVDAGKIEYEALERAGFDEEWLREKLKKDTEYDVDDVYFAEWNKNTGFFAQGKRK